MKEYDFISLLNSKELKDKEAVITIGVFDGVHLGHQTLIKRVKEESIKLPSSISMVITFSSNPKPGKFRNIDTLRLRKEEVEKEGIDAFVVIDFSHEFSMISASGFIEMLTSLTTPKTVVVGEDFRFGNPSSSASAQDLGSIFHSLGIDTKVIIEKAILTEGGEKISSTLVRRVIEKGETGCIPSLIGRKYRVDLMPCPFRLEDGALVYGKDSIHQLLPPPGVYEVESLDESGLICNGLCNVEDDYLRFKPTDKDKTELSTCSLPLDSIFFGERK
ncbi:MAG: FAD synthetase family protein [Candidatus Ornithospirochaeta sp.]